MRLVFSGGGTGGHIFPAVAVAQHIKNKYPDVQILFIGAKGKMEEKKVPKEGFEIKTLWISGFQRRLTWSNILFPLKLVVSVVQAFIILKKFKPDAVAGFGGYASGAALYTATLLGIPSLIQEQNSLPGVTNKLLSKKVDKICNAYESANRYFPESKTIHTGNPVRTELRHRESNKSAARLMLGLNESKKTILIVGGSLGARSINRALRDQYKELSTAKDIQILWQCGSLYYEEYKNCDTAKLEHVKILGFIEDMAVAYDAADVVICRAGALTISELMVLAKAVVLVPSPNVAEDHQTKNAMVLVENEAALLLKDEDLNNGLSHIILNITNDDKQIEKLERNILKMAMPKATELIANELVSLATKGKK